MAGCLVHVAIHARRMCVFILVKRTRAGEEKNTLAKRWRVGNLIARKKKKVCVQEKS